MVDVAVLGAGLAGLRRRAICDRAGADVLVLEARERPGGRVEAVALPDGRIVQAGGEVVRPRAHRPTASWSTELGLTVERSYVADPGEMSWGLNEGVFIGDDAPWMTAARARRRRAHRPRVRGSGGDRRPRRSVEPPARPRRLDRLSLGAWLREQHALPAVLAPPRARVAVAVVRRSGAHLAAGASCASTRRSPARASMTWRSGRGCASPRVRPRSRLRMAVAARRAVRLGAQW